MNKVICNRCNKGINYKEDLVVTTYVLPFFLRKYHNACYAQREKTTGGFFLVGSKPINSKVYTYVGMLGIPILVILAAVYALLPNGNPSVVVLFILFIIYAAIFLYTRVRSYYKYEKPLPSRNKINETNFL